MNDNKTEVIEIGPYINHFNDILLCGSKVSLVDKAKNLGFVFDDSLFYYKLTLH